jgi:hypothetical protein
MIKVTFIIVFLNHRYIWDPLALCSSNCLLESLMMAVLETPKHVAFLKNVNNKNFGCVRLYIV